MRIHFPIDDVTDKRSGKMLMKLENAGRKHPPGRPLVAVNGYGPFFKTVGTSYLIT